jgi:hypothetical protein
MNFIRAGTARPVTTDADGDRMQTALRAAVDVAPNVRARPVLLALSSNAFLRSFLGYLKWRSTLFESEDSSE